MNLKSVSKWKLLILFLLISLSCRFVNANDDDEGNPFAKKKSSSKEPQTVDETLRAVRDYLDLLCINWNGYFYSLGANTAHSNRILVTYLERVSSAYARVLQLYNYNGDAVSRALYGQFLGYIVPRMRDVTRFLWDSPIRGGPSVYQYSVSEHVQDLVPDEQLRQQRWTHPSRDRPQLPPPKDGIVPIQELERLIFQRVPYPEPDEENRPRRPWGDRWRKVSNSNHPAIWQYIDLRTDITWNHLVPYAEIRYLFESYNRLWLRNNEGNVWFAHAFLIRLEIRLATLVILRADLDMQIPRAANILRSIDHYVDRALSYNMWSASNLFIGPRDDLRCPRPSLSGPGKFETQASKVYRSDEWSREGYSLTGDIMKFKKIPQHKQNLPDLLGLYYRFVRLLQTGGSDELWLRIRQGVEPANLSHYDIHERSPNQELLQRFQNIVSEDIRNNEERRMVASEYERLRRMSVPDTIIKDTIDQRLKPGGDLYNKLEPDRKKKLDKIINDHFAHLQISRFIFSGPKESSNWKTLQKTSECVGKNLKINIKTCDKNIIFDPNSPSTSSGSGSGSASSEVFFDFSNLKIVEHDSGIDSGGSSRRPSDEVCGATQDHRNMLIDPSIISHPPPDISSINNAHEIDEDFYEDTEESLQDAALDSCAARKDQQGDRRNKRHSPACTMEIIKSVWQQCKDEVKV